MTIFAQHKKQDTVSNAQKYVKYMD